MSVALKINDDLIREAKIIGKVDKRSLKSQIEHWVQTGKYAEENHDLTNRLES